MWSLMRKVKVAILKSVYRWFETNNEQKIEFAELKEILCKFVYTGFKKQIKKRKSAEKTQTDAWLSSYLGELSAGRPDSNLC
jgi:hypothetical protein